MAVKLVFLGRLADLAGGGEREVEIACATGWDALLAMLDAPLAKTLREDAIRVARNGELIADKRALLARLGDEIAFLPPVSGG